MSDATFMKFKQKIQDFTRCFSAQWIFERNARNPFKNLKNNFWLRKSDKYEVFLSFFKILNAYQNVCSKIDFYEFRVLVTKILCTYFSYNKKLFIKSRTIHRLKVQTSKNRSKYCQNISKTVFHIRVTSLK